jgi:hypothetical protein
MWGSSLWKCSSPEPCLAAAKQHSVQGLHVQNRSELPFSECYEHGYLQGGDGSSLRRSESQVAKLSFSWKDILRPYARTTPISQGLPTCCSLETLRRVLEDTMVMKIYRFEHLLTQPRLSRAAQALHYAIRCVGSVEERDQEIMQLLRGGVASEGARDNLCRRVCRRG